MTSAEIPFRIGSNQKWISGISEDTTCRDILVAVLQSESLLDCDEEVVHHHFALVETWRQVSKVLSPNSLILKIWLAWDEEQSNVMFSVKRIKNDKRTLSTNSSKDVQQTLETGQDARSRKTVKRRNSKIGTSSKLDTVHPRALNRSKQMVCKEIQDQMKKIINQGEIIRKHLENMKEFENSDEKSDHPASSEAPLGLDSSRTQMISVEQNLTPQKYSFLDKSDNNSDSAFNESFLDSPSPKNNPTRQPSTSENVSFESINLENPPQKCSKPEFISESDQTINTPVPGITKAGPKYSSPSGPIQEPKNSKDNQSSNVEDQGMVFNLLENIHRLNCLLESKEEQVLTLGSTVQMVGDGPQSQDKAVNSLDIKSCFDQEVAHYRDLNARLLSEIQVNSGQLEVMVRNTNMRRKMVTQLEFDVNIIERESKRLQSDLSTIQSMGTKLPHNYADKEDQRVNQEQSPRSPSTCHQESPRNSDNHPPDCSPKSTQEVTNNSNAGYQQKQTSDYNSVKKVLEYGSDSSSDTGVCSLSSTEGDYSLSTLV